MEKIEIILNDLVHKAMNVCSSHDELQDAKEEASTLIENIIDAAYDKGVEDEKYKDLI